MAGRLVSGGQARSGCASSRNLSNVDPDRPLHNTNTGGPGELTGWAALWATRQPLAEAGIAWSAIRFPPDDLVRPAGPWWTVAGARTALSRAGRYDSPGPPSMLRAGRNCTGTDRPVVNPAQCDADPSAKAEVGLASSQRRHASSRPRMAGGRRGTGTWQLHSTAAQDCL